MAFNHIGWTARMLAHWAATKTPFNDSLYLKNPPGIKLATGPSGGRAWRVIGIHHLTPDENRGNRNVFMGILTDQGTRLFPAWGGWTWEGKRPSERADPFPLDKPNDEPPGNISVGGNQKVTVWALGPTNPAPQGTLTDEVFNLHTLHPDEDGPHGEKWNTIGHHSFFVVLKLDFVAGTSQIPDPQPPGAAVKTFEHSWSQPGLRGTVKIEVDRW